MIDFLIFVVVYILVAVVAFFSMQSFFQKIEIENELKVSFVIKIKLAFACSMAYLLPLLFYKYAGQFSLIIYLLTIPILIFYIKNLSSNSISLKTAAFVFWGLFIKFIFSIIVLGAISRLLMKFIK